jgi:hypothetical protein
MKLLFENWRKYLNEGQNTSDGWEQGPTSMSARWETATPTGTDPPPPPPPPPTQEPEEDEEEPEQELSEEEESIVRHNLHMLDTMGGPAATDRFGLSRLKEKDLMNLVASIPTLRRNKIVKAIGAGTKKTVYKLDNDHIFSVFQSGYGGDEYSDLGWYAGIQDRQFKGQSSIDEPAIHDYGSTKVPKKFEQGGTNYEGNFLKYVEMSGVVPLSIEGPPSMGEMAEFDLVRLDFDIVQIAKFVEASLYHGMLIKDPSSLDKKVELVQHWWRNRKGLPFAGEEDLLDLEIELTPDLTMNLIKTLVKLAVRLKTIHVLQDVHPGNLGMSIEKSDEFVVIDI